MYAALRDVNKVRVTQLLFKVSTALVLVLSLKIWKKLLIMLNEVSMSTDLQKGQHNVKFGEKMH